MALARTYYRDRDVFIMSGAIVVGNVRYPLAKMSGLYIARRSHAVRTWLILVAAALITMTLIVSWAWPFPARLLALCAVGGAAGLGLRYFKGKAAPKSQGRYVLGCYVDDTRVEILATNDRILLGHVRRALIRALADLE